jgi:hypothetical protein
MLDCWIWLGWVLGWSSMCISTLSELVVLAGGAFLWSITVRLGLGQRPRYLPTYLGTWPRTDETIDQDGVLNENVT